MIRFSGGERSPGQKSIGSGEVDCAPCDAIFFRNAGHLFDGAADSFGQLSHQARTSATKTLSMRPIPLPRQWTPMIAISVSDAIAR